MTFSVMMAMAVGIFLGWYYLRKVARSRSHGFYSAGLGERCKRYHWHSVHLACCVSRRVARVGQHSPQCSVHFPILLVGGAGCCYSCRLCVVVFTAAAFTLDYGSLQFLLLSQSLHTYPTFDAANFRGHRLNYVVLVHVSVGRFTKIRTKV